MVFRAFQISLAEGDKGQVDTIKKDNGSGNQSNCESSPLRATFGLLHHYLFSQHLSGQTASVLRSLCCNDFCQAVINTEHTQSAQVECLNGGVGPMF